MANNMPPHPIALGVFGGICLTVAMILFISAMLGAWIEMDPKNLHKDEANDMRPVVLTLLLMGSFFFFCFIAAINNW